MALPNFGLITKADKQKLDTIPSDSLLTVNTANNTYLTTSAASTSYLTQSSASSTYLKKTDASSTYLTQTNAANTYLKKTDASSTYLTQTDATNTYLKKTDASSTYLAQNDAANTYMTKTAAQAYINEAVANAGGGGVSLSKSSTINVGGNCTVTAADSDKYILGSKLSDTIWNAASNVIIDERQAGNVIINEGSNNIYIWRADGNSTICGYNTNDTLVIDSFYVTDTVIESDCLKITSGDYNLILRGPLNTTRFWLDTGLKPDYFAPFAAGDNIKAIHNCYVTGAPVTFDKSLLINNFTEYTNNDNNKNFNVRTGNGNIMLATLFNYGDYCSIGGGHPSCIVYDNGNYSSYYFAYELANVPMTLCGFNSNDTFFCGWDSHWATADKVEPFIKDADGFAVSSWNDGYIRTLKLKGARISGTTANSPECFAEIPKGAQTVLTLRDGNGKVWQPVIYESIGGTSSVDNITNNNDYVIISVRGGADIIDNRGHYCSILADTGNDSISNSGNYVTINGGVGKETVSNTGHHVYCTLSSSVDAVTNTGDYCTLYTSSAADTINNSGGYCFIYANGGSDSIINSGNYCYIGGGSEADTIANTGSFVTIEGDSGTDIIFNDGSNNVYIWNASSTETICGFGANDTLVITGKNAVFQASTNAYCASVGSSVKLWLKGSRISGQSSNAAASFNLLTSGSQICVYNNSDEASYITIE